MDFMCQFKNGPYHRKLSRITVPEFKVGLRISVNDNLYEVLPGPAATYFEQEQKDHPNLAACARFVEEPIMHEYLDAREGK